MDCNMGSARTSLISSVDSCYTNDSTNFACMFAVAAETMSGASLSGEQRRNCSFAVCSLQVMLSLEKTSLKSGKRMKMFAAFTACLHQMADSFHELSCLVRCRFVAIVIAYRNLSNKNKNHDVHDTSSFRCSCNFLQTFLFE